MKFTRSFWLGLGSGLILSAMLALIFSPQHQQAAVNSQASFSKEKETSKTEETQPLQSLDSRRSPTEQVLSSESESSRIEKDFVIPKGASADKIAELLLDQGFIKDKEAFLDSAYQLGAERQFQAGTFKLSLGLTGEELIKRLLK